MPRETRYVQRIWDYQANGTGGFVYYTLPYVTDAPLPEQTTPRHSGDLDRRRHRVLHRVEVNTDA